MKLLFKQRFFSLLDSYDIYDESGAVVYTVKDQFSLGHLLYIYDAGGFHAATVRQKIPYFWPVFELELCGNYLGRLTRQFSPFHPRYVIESLGWTMEGSFMEWNYTISDGSRVVAAITKELWNLTDTYVIEVTDEKDALSALMVVLAIDAEKCSRG